MSITAQEALEESRRRERERAQQQAPRTAQEALERLKAAEGPPLPQQIQSAQGPLTVNRTPIPMPGDVNVGIQSRATPPMLNPSAQMAGQLPPATIQQATPQQRRLAEQGIDVYGGLDDWDLRHAIGFSPNQAFTADFLAKKLGEKYGLDPADAVKQLPDGTIVFFKPGEGGGRYTPIDEGTVTKQDLADMYGPAHTIGPVVAGAIGGSLFGRGANSAAALSVGAASVGGFVGEIMRLYKGRQLGVHNLDNGEIIDHGLSIMKDELLWGAGGELATKLARIGRTILAKYELEGQDAKRILLGMEENSGIVSDVNDILRRTGRNEEFKLTPPHQAGDLVGIGGIHQSSLVSTHQKAARQQEIDLEVGALRSALRGITGADEGLDQITDPALAGPAQRAMLAEKQRLDELAARSLTRLEDESRYVLASYGQLDEAASGADMKRMVQAYSDTLATTRKDAYNAYQISIGQPVEGITPSWSPATRLTSNVKIPVDRNVAQLHAAAAGYQKASTLSGAATGKNTIKPLKPGTHVDLAVIDEDIKVLRNLIRNRGGDFNTIQAQRDVNALVDMRNNYLRNNHPSVMIMLENAENARTAEGAFVDNSIFSRIFKRNEKGAYKIDDTAALMAVWQDSTGAAMGELVNVAKRFPGGLLALQQSAMRVYRSNVSLRNSDVLSLDLHEKFVENNKHIMKRLFPDPSMYRFGDFADRMKAAEKIQLQRLGQLNQSALWRLGKANPENMAKLVFSDKMSIANITSTTRVMKQEGAEALNSWRDSVGRQVWKIATDGNDGFTTAKLGNIIRNYGDKLGAVYGDQFVRDLKALKKGLERQSIPFKGARPPNKSLLGYLARVFISPPLTAKGRAQSLVEKARGEAGIRLMNDALRDPRILHKIVMQGEFDAAARSNVRFLSLVGASALTMDEKVLED